MSLWQPTSTCTPEACIPDGGTPGMAAVACVPRAVLRIAAVLAVLCAGIVLSPVAFRCARGPRERVVRFWCRALVRAAGVRVRVTGAIPAEGGMLVVANHISWLDIPLLAAVRPARMLAKSDVRGWPVAGALAVRGRTLFIDRSRPRALPDTVREMADALRAGSAVSAFPEGSTWCGRKRGVFRRAVFQAALDADVPVQPIHLRYTASSGAVSGVPAFIGEDTLVGSLWRIVTARGIVADVLVRPVLSAAAHPDRRALARAAQAALHLPAGTAPGDAVHAGAVETGAVYPDPAPPGSVPVGALLREAAPAPMHGASAAVHGASAAVRAVSQGR